MTGERAASFLHSGLEIDSRPSGKRFQEESPNAGPEEPKGPGLLTPTLPAGEVRHTSDSGGQKGKKPETYRLIPSAFETLVENRLNTTTDLTTLLRWEVERFWYALRNNITNLGATDRLVEAAAIAADVLGGKVAMRYHVARVYGAGALKYDDDNWRKGYPWSWSYDALHRHLEAIRRGEMIDVGTPENPGTGAPHWANVWWHCATLWTFATEGLGTDDRPKKEVK